MARVLGLFSVILNISTYFVYSRAQTLIPPPCSSNVYCKGPLLHAVQLARIYPDSKTFVDMRMIKTENETLKDYEDFISGTPKPNKTELAKFVDDHFLEGNELMQWTMTDFDPNPPILEKIVDLKLKKFAKDIINIWPELGRKISPEVSENPDKFSLIPLPNGFVIPGGRFKEIYYWDSYWIIEGLIISGMTETARGMIENLMHMVKTLGHVLNGSRVYYRERSQPPLLTAMVAKYIEATGDLKWLREHISVLEDELNFWNSKRTVVVNKDGKDHILLRYYAKSTGPRPESYYVDYINSIGFDTEERRTEFYTDLKSAAESGWDFSNRWFVSDNDTISGNLTDIHTNRIIPVDLNAIYASALETVGNFNMLLRNRRSAITWWTQAKTWREAIDDVLWDDEAGIWYDYNLETKKSRKYFYPSNVAPAWRKCVDEDKLAAYAPKIMNYLSNSGGLNFPGGIPTSLAETGEQWDFPNAWPPLQSVVVEALENLNTPESKELAMNLAQMWIRANYKGFEKHEEMFEKYDSEKPGEFGGGGEYVVQKGFGWSNGVVLEFLDKYGEVLSAEDVYH